MSGDRVDKSGSGARRPVQPADLAVLVQTGREADLVHTALVEAGVPAVIGSDSSDVTLAIADLFQQSEVVLISPSSSTPALSNKGSFIFRNFPSDDLEAVNTANHIYNVAGCDPWVVHQWRHILDEILVDQNLLEHWQGLQWAQILDVVFTNDDLSELWQSSDC